MAEIWEIFTARNQIDRLTLFGSFAALTAILFLLNIIYLITAHPLSKIPGPFLAKFTKKWQDYHAAKLQKARAIHGQILAFHFTCHSHCELSVLMW